MQLILAGLMMVVSWAAGAVSQVPDAHTVVEGDTLWDIAQQYYQEAVRWTEIEAENPEIDDPDLIYPQQRLRLPEGVLVKAVSAGDEDRQASEAWLADRTVKLTPQIQVHSLEDVVPKIPREALHPFLNRARVVDASVFKTAPYVIAKVGEGMMAGSGDSVYVRGAQAGEHGLYLVVRQGDPIVHPDTHKVLGYEAKELGEAHGMTAGKLSTFDLTRVRKEVMAGDRLLPIDEDVAQAFYTPARTQTPVHSQILSVYDGVDDVGQYQVVLIQGGQAEGLKVGDWLGIYKAGAKVKDPTAKKRRKTLITLPQEHVGELMVFRTFEHVSYAVILSATDSIHIFDKIKNL